MNQNDLLFLPTAPCHKAPDDAPALFDDNSSAWMTYGDLRRSIKAAQTAVASDKHSLVFCCIPRTIDGVIGYLSAAAAGHAITMVDPTIPHLSKVIETYEPEWIMAPDAILPEGYSKTPWTLSSLYLWKRNVPAAGDIHPDFYLMLLTSGSTGNSKGCRLSYKNMISNTESIIHSQDLTSVDRALLHLPLSYSFGISVLHTELAVGGSCLLTEKGLMDSDLWKKARDQEAVLFPGVPYHYEMLMKLGLQRLNLPKLTMFIQAGGKMRLDQTQEMLAAVQKINARLYIMYGQTEAAPRISCFPLHKRPEKIGAAGLAMKGGVLTLEEGEVVYTGPNVMLGYAEKRSDLALGDVTHGRLVTGDMGHIDDEGFLTLLGRKQRFAKLYGQRVALDDLEKFGRTIAPVIAVEGNDVAVLFITKEYAALADKIRTHVSSETKFPPTWFDVRVIDEIPHQSSGKVDYRKLKDSV